MLWIDYFHGGVGRYACFSGALRWRHNDHAGVSNHQPPGCLLNRLFRRKSKKTSKLRVTGLCAGNSPGTGEFSAQMASYAENVSIWWRHHGEIWPASLLSHCMYCMQHSIMLNRIMRYLIELLFFSNRIWHDNQHPTIKLLSIRASDTLLYHLCLAIINLQIQLIKKNSQIYFCVVFLGLHNQCLWIDVVYLHISFHVASMEMSLWGNPEGYR